MEMSKVLEMIELNNQFEEIKAKLEALKDEMKAEGEQNVATDDGVKVSCYKTVKMSYKDELVEALKQNHLTSFLKEVVDTKKLKEAVENGVVNNNFILPYQVPSETMSVKITMPKKK